MRRIFYIFILISIFILFDATLFAAVSVPGEIREEEEELVTVSGIGPDKTPLNQKCVSILNEAKRIYASGGELGDIFKKMGQKGVGFKDLIAFKADYQNNTVKDLVAQGMSGEEATAKALEKWNSEYRAIEQQMVNRRQQMVKLVWSAALIEYMRNNPDSTLLAKGDIEGWATETIEKMRFESDIDFTLFAVETEDAVKLRDLFESKLKSVFGLDMRQFDAFCTAQRRAENDVYIGEWGAKWGEIDMFERGKAQMFYYKDDGTLAVKEVPAKEMLKIYHKKRKTFSDEVFKPTADMEPGISLEMLRHIRAEIFKGKFSTIERMIKMCKYLNRSAKDHKALLGDSATTGNRRLADFAREVTEAKQNSKNIDETINRIFVLADDYLGKSWSSDPVNALKELAKRCDHEIRHNISEAIDYHNKRIEEIKDPAKKAEEYKWLEDVLAKEKKAYDHDGLKFPDDAGKALGRYEGAGEAYRLFGEKAVEYVKFMSDTAGSTKIAMSYLLTKADQNIDKVNNFLDYLDNTTIEKIRNSDVSIKVIKGEKTLHSVSIGSINRSLNDSILGKIGNNTAFKGFNLGQETYAYYNAYANASSPEEAFSNIATELFRRRVPGGGMAEAVIMENYTRAGLEVAYMIFPPLAIPEAVYSIGAQIKDAGVEYYWTGELDALTEDIYTYASFKPVPGSKGARWKLTSLRGPDGYEYKTLKQFILGDEHTSEIFYRAVAADPLLLQFKKLMEHPSVGQDTKYGRKIKIQYDEREIAAAEDLLKKLIKSLEERMAAEALGQGIGKKRMEEIREALSCGTKPLVPESGDVEVDGKMYRDAMLDFEKHMEAVGEIEELSGKCGAELAYYKPVCNLDSLKMAAGTNPSLAVRYADMIKEVRGELTKIKGSFDWADKRDKDDMKALMEYRKLAEPDLSNQADLWEEKYRETLRKIKARYSAKVTDIVIFPEDEDIYEGDEVKVKAEFDLPEKEGTKYSWTISGVEYEGFEGQGEDHASFIPTLNGTLSVTFTIERDGDVIGERKETAEVYAVTLEGLTLEIEGEGLLSKDNDIVRVKALTEYSDNSEADVTEYALWEVVSGENVKVDKGEISLTEAESYTPEPGTVVTVRAEYEGKKAEIDIPLELALRDLKAYWETAPALPEIPFDSDPHGIEVTFRATTGDPDNNDKREFKWTFQKEDGSYEEVYGFEVKRFYSELGVYGVLLTVTDEWGNVDEEHETIAIEEEYMEEDMPEENEEIEVEEGLKFETPTGNMNVYKGELNGGGLAVERYDWKTPLNKDAGFVKGAYFDYTNVGYFNPSTCLYTGPIEKGTAFNPGYLIYYGNSDKSLHYAVLGTGQDTKVSSVFVKDKNDYSHSGTISESYGKVRKDSIKITKVSPRGYDISWTDTDGFKWSATVNKYGGYTDVECLASDEDQTFGDKNKYVGKYNAAAKKLIVKRFDWETPINKKAGFSAEPVKSWQYVNAGYWKGDTCLKAGPAEPPSKLNPGYVIYYDAVRKGIVYAVLGDAPKVLQTSAYSKTRPDFSHSGLIGESVNKAIKESIVITSALSRSFRVEWTDKNGDAHSAIVWKYSDNGGYTYEGKENGREKTSLLAEQVAKEMGEMMSEEDNEEISREELIMLIEEEVQQMQEEEKAGNGKASGKRSVDDKKIDEDKISDKIGKKVKKTLERKKERIVDVEDPTVRHYKLYRPDGRLYMEFDYITVARAVVEVPFLEIMQYHHKIYSKEDIIGNFLGKRYGCFEFFDMFNNLDKKDIWYKVVYHGKVMSYSDEDGTLSVINTYDKGKLKGQYKHSIGPGRSGEGNWEVGNYENGQKQGPVSFQYGLENGKIYGKGQYTNGKKEGTWYYWNDNGEYYEVVAYKNDKRVWKKAGIFTYYYDTNENIVNSVVNE